jgi:hypothetical protein
MSRAMDSIKRDVAAGSAPHWFSRDTMAFHGSRIENYPVSRANDRHNRRFFITSEDNFDRTVREFSIRYASTNPQTNDTVIETLGMGGEYSTMSEAIDVIVRLFDLALDIGWDAVVDLEGLA